MMKSRNYLSQIGRIAIAAGIVCAASLCFAGQGDDEARMQENWREAISRTAVPAAGCFHATYPSLSWIRVQCTTAPNVPFIPRTGVGHLTVGDGNDYVAEVSSGFISKTVGSFPAVTGVKSETGIGGANSYSLQLNSNFMSKSKACKGAASPSQCLAWEQFIYSSDSEAVFMQYWLINYNNSCPNGWNSFQSDCYTNSNAVGAPKEAIKTLKTLKISATAVKGGLDTNVFTAGTHAYSTTGKDSVVYLATGWQESEFNIFGDGDGSGADFNSGSHVTVEVQVTNGTDNAPVCKADSGTTGETNNLNLGSCTGTAGASPYVKFGESN
jgi:hypothetical protein